MPYRTAAPLPPAPEPKALPAPKSFAEQMDSLLDELWRIQRDHYLEMRRIWAAKEEERFQRRLRFIKTGKWV